MQVGFDVGATKIESVVLEKDGQEKHRSRISCPKDYTQIITSIKNIFYEVGISYKGRTYLEGKKIGFVDVLVAIYCIVRYSFFD